MSEVLTADDPKVYTKHEMVLEVRMVTMETELKAIRKDIEELKDLVKSDNLEIKHRVTSLEKSKTWTLGWIAGVTLVVTVMADIVRRVMGW